MVKFCTTTRVEIDGVTILRQSDNDKWDVSDWSCLTMEGLARVTEAIAAVMERYGYVPQEETADVGGEG